MEIRRENLVLKDTGGYLPSTDSPVTAMNMIYKVLMKACQMEDKLKLKYVVVVFDQAIYAKVAGIMRKH